MGHGFFPSINNIKKEESGRSKTTILTLLQRVTHIKDHETY